MASALKPGVKSVLLGLCLLATACGGAFGQTQTWNGGAGDYTWSTGSNWSGGTEPNSTTAAVAFGTVSGTTPTISVTDVGGITLASLTYNFGATAFTLGGNAITFGPQASGGTVVIANNTASTIETINNNVVLAGGRVSSNSAGLVLAGGVTITNTNQIQFFSGAGGTLTLSGLITGGTSSNSLFFAGSTNGTGTTVIGNASNTFLGTLTFQDSTILLNGNATNNGTASVLGMGTNTINLGGAGTNTVSVLTNGAYTVARNFKALSGDTGTVTLGGYTADVSTFSGSIAMGSNGSTGQALTFTAAAGGRANFTGNITAPSSATTTGDTATKTGAGIVAFSGNNTYAGGTVVSQGTLLVNNPTGSGTGTGGIQVLSGATLGGSGFVVPSAITSGVAVNIASGAFLSPSNGTGTGFSHLTFTLGGTSTVNLASGSKFAFNLGAGTSTSDEVIVNGGGGLTLNSQQFSDFTFNLETGFGAGSYILFDTNSASGITGSLAGSGLTGALGGSYSGTLALGVDGSGNAAVVLNVVAVPEPSVWVLLGSGLFALGFARRQSLRFLVS